MTYGDEEKEHAYKTACQQFELQEKIAGPSYAMVLRRYQHEISNELDKWKKSETTEKGYKQTCKAIDLASEQVLRRIDDGTLYTPQTATSS